MKYNKKALTLDQQVDLLVQRGMSIPDRDRAKQHLLHINYYRLRAYWLPCEISASPGDHAFKADTHFEDILGLYSFDRKLRLMVMDAIERVEVSLRTGWAYVLANKYGPHAYENPAFFRGGARHQDSLDNLSKELKNSRETFVEHYFANYKHPALPPLWAVCEVMSFGQLSWWFKNLGDAKDRAAIAAPYKIDEQILISFCHHLAYVRNACAHHSRLWNREMTIGTKLPRNPKSLFDSFNLGQPKRVYNTLCFLAYLVEIICPGTHWRQSVLDLINGHPKIDRRAMGFPANWASLPVWQI